MHRVDKNPLRNPADLASGQYASGSNLAARSALHDQFSSTQRPFRLWEADLVNWTSCRDVLDVGTGTGRFWDNAELPRHLSLTLLDISAGMVSEASALAARGGFERVHLSVADAQHLPFADASFDVVVANHMLYHVPEPAAAVAEFRRVLRHDGVALIATNASGHMRQLNEAIAEVFGPFDLGLNSVFGIENGEEVLRRYFSNIAWRSFVNPLLVTDPEAVASYAMSIPPAQHATADQASDLMAVIAQRMEAAGGVFRIDTRTGAFVCSGHAP